MKRSLFTLKYQKYHPINWSSNLSSSFDVGWIDFIFQFSQWSICASGVKVIIHYIFLHYPIDSTLSNQNQQKWKIIMWLNDKWVNLGIVGVINLVFFYFIIHPSHLQRIKTKTWNKNHKQCKWRIITLHILIITQSKGSYHKIVTKYGHSNTDSPSHIPKKWIHLIIIWPKNYLTIILATFNNHI